MITAYDLVSDNKKLLLTLSDMGINTRDVRFVGAYEEYLQRKENGEKTTVIISDISSVLSVSESTLYNIFRKLSINVK